MNINYLVVMAKKKRKFMDVILGDQDITPPSTDDPVAVAAWAEQLTLLQMAELSRRWAYADDKTAIQLARAHAELIRGWKQGRDIAVERAEVEEVKRRVQLFETRRKDLSTDGLQRVVKK